MKRNLIAAVAMTAALTLPAQANNIVDEWASTKAPAAPTLKPVTVDPKTTALLMLDFMNQNCGKRPRCLDTIPAMKKLLDAARAAKATVVYSLIANTTAADVIKDVAPATGEASVLSGPDKFLKDGPREDPQGQGHYDSHCRWHVVQWCRALHGEWCCAPRHECDHSGRRHVGGRSLRRIQHRIHFHERAVGVSQDDIDEK